MSHKQNRQKSVRQQRKAAGEFKESKTFDAGSAVANTGAGQMKTKPYPTYTPYPTPTPAAKSVPVPTNTPQPVQPGRTLDDAVEAGGVLQGSNGTEIVAVSINPNAWAWIEDNSSWIDFVGPPDEGKRYYMVTVEISYISGVGTLEVDEYDFNLIGSSRFVYDTHCVTDLHEELSGEIFLGGKAQGNVCFEAPEEESGFVLIHEPGNARSRRYLNLE